MGYIYILASDNKRALYIGVTNDLLRRLWEHKNECVDGFTKRYHVHHLVHYEEFSSIKDAIEREKQLKRWSREKKERLIESTNPDWTDLSDDWE